MQIILMHSRFAQAKSITVQTHHWLISLLLIISALTSGIFLLYYLTFSYITHSIAHSGTSPFAPLFAPFISDQLKTLISSAAEKNSTDQDRLSKEKLAAMAIKLGDIQAQLVRLDALGERVQNLAGIRPQEFNFREPPPRGGLEPSNATRELSMTDVQSTLGELTHNLDQRADYMNVIENALITHKVQAKLLPTAQPTSASYTASSFGWRIDPFTGRLAMHEGIDFPAAVGTSIVAAAPGVVVAAHFHPQYGNMIDIDHGKDLMTRYAHTSRMLVKVGDIVKRGQPIAEIGSTGRSTGPHLHFEVRLQGVAQDPRKFLAAGTFNDLHAVALLQQTNQSMHGNAHKR